MPDGYDLVRRSAQVRIRSMAVGCEALTLARGKVVAYSPQPMVCVEDEHGRQTWWLLAAAEEVPGA